MVDIVGRYGGDEFVIVLSAVNDRTEIQVVLKKIMATFKDPFETAGRSVRLTLGLRALSVGTGWAFSRHSTFVCTPQRSG